MAALSDAKILQLCETGLALSLPERALAILHAAEPGETPTALAELSPGARDLRLLAVRQETFGEDLPSLTTCPHCGEILEFTFQAGALARSGEKPVEREAMITSGRFRVHFRLPTAGDLVEIGRAGGDPAAARLRLLECCVLAAWEAEQPSAPAELPEAVRAAVAGRMAELDAAGDLLLALACPACGHRWDAVLDPAGYLWEEVRLKARQVLQQVHWLARAYGWPEREILAMTPWRRRAYLELAYE